MDAQRTPDELAIENALICEKLLGWEKVLMPEDNYPAFKRSWCHDPIYAPDFTTWADAGLILEALATKGCDWDIESTHTDAGVKATVRVFFSIPNSATGRKRECLGTPFQAIRAAALAYIKAVKA